MGTMSLCSDSCVVSGLRVTLAVSGISFMNVWTPDTLFYHWIMDRAGDVSLHKGVAWENWSMRKPPFRPQERHPVIVPKTESILIQK